LLSLYSLGGRKVLQNILAERIFTNKSRASRKMPHREREREREREMFVCAFVFAAQRQKSAPRGPMREHALVFLGSISFTHALLSNKIVAAAVAATSPRSHANAAL
jgi:hypothetical protein